MVEEVLGQVLKINSLDVMPSVINHNNEYLRVKEDETAYEYVSIDDIKTELPFSYEKNAVVNSGYNLAIDTCTSYRTTGLIYGNCCDGYVVTTNGTQYNSSYPVSNAYLGLNGNLWIAAKADNVYLQLQTPEPIAYTRILKCESSKFSDMDNFSPLNFVVEASNNGVDFVEMLNHTALAWSPYNRETFSFNESKTPYRYWRLRYPTGGALGEIFYFFFIADDPLVNLFSQNEFEKNKLVKLKTFWMHQTIPYRTTYTDAANHGTVSGSANITEYNTSNQIWQAFRGAVSASNEGWLSANTQAVPCDLIYTPATSYPAGYYQFCFRNGIWSDNSGYSAIALDIIIVDENDTEVYVSTKAYHCVRITDYATDVMYVPFAFKKVLWRITSKYATTHVSIGNCQVWQANDDLEGSFIMVKNIWQKNTGMYIHAGGYLHRPDIEYNVSEENPLVVTFPDNTKYTYTSLQGITIKPQKKFRLITPEALNSETYDSSISPAIAGNQDYIDMVNGSCSGEGSQYDADRSFWKAICRDNRTYNDCWLTSANGALGGTIYTWTQTKPAGRYVFKFNTGWWVDTNGYSAKEVKINVRNGATDTWKTVWHVNDIAATYATYMWSPVIDIDFEFNQVYFQVIARNQNNHVNLASCAVYQECDADYVIASAWSDENIRYVHERACEFALDYVESQNLFLKKDGTTYGLSNNVFRQSEQPLNAAENDVWYDNSHEPLRVYQLKNGEWQLFNDVLLGNFNLVNGLIQSFHENAYNDNATFKNSDCVWSTELTLSDEATVVDGDIFTYANMPTLVYHNLNIQDVTKYKAECYLKCVVEDAGYEPGELAMNAVRPLSATFYNRLTPFLTKNTVGIRSGDVANGFKVAHKYSGAMVDIATDSRWRLVFKIREL